MPEKYRLISLLICVLLSLQLMSCSITSSSASSETSKTENVFEAAITSGESSSSSSETAATTEMTTTTETTAVSETSATTASTSESTASSTKEPTPVPTETTGTTSATSESTSPSESTSATKTPEIPKDCLAVYEAEPQDKKNYILFNNAAGSTITSQVSGTGFAGAEIPLSDIYLTGKLPADAMEFTIFYDERMNFTLRDLSGNFLVMTAEGSLILTDKPVADWYQFWRMEKVDGGWIIVNTGDSVKKALRCNNGVFTAEPYFTNSSFVFNFFEVG